MIVMKQTHPTGARRYSAKIVAGGFAASISEARHLVVSEIASGGGGAGRGGLRRGPAAWAAAPEAARGRPGAARAAANSTAGGGGATPGSGHARARRLVRGEGRGVSD